ncbi:MAG: FtsX-like permease family protein [Puniceicoccales bacterium]|jgi:lipoprotein-releasing system permease protein|nr:FtsX-like permease family protein [Puniceicoccales bacterium]
MSTNLAIALRFLLFKKRAMLMTLSGIVFGVAFFVLTQAQTSGFEELFIKTILGSDGALRVADRRQPTFASTEIAASGDAGATLQIENYVKHIEGVDYPDTLRERLRAFPEITATAEVLRGNARLESARASADAQVFGMRLRDFRAVSNIEGQIIAGDLADFERDPQGLILGSELAGPKRAAVKPGDVVVLNCAGTAQRFTVSCVFETGVGDIDKVRAIAHLGAARSLLKKPFGATYIQASMRDPALAEPVAERVGPIVGHHIAPWQRRERVWLTVFTALRLSSAVTVSSIIIVSALGMFNTLAMLVIEKTREIAILRSFGFTRGDVTRIFLWLGFTVIVLGSLLGCAAGALLTWGAENVPLRIRGVFSTEHFVVNWSASHYLAAVATAVVVVSVASYFPARRAARIEPGEIIRGASS